MNQIVDVKGVKLLAAKVEGVDMNGLRDLGDQLKEKLGEGVVVLASGNDGKVSLMVTATDAAMKQGAHAGNLVKAIAGLVGGGGGGRPNMAQAGGKNPEKVPEAISKIPQLVEEQIKESFPGYTVYRAFTSQMILNKLERTEHKKYDNVRQALERMKQDGITRVIVQPTHIINGIENEKNAGGDSKTCVVF